ncbi:MAG TPA: SDR family oxidoreductase [Myxococcaceae bacterium]|nr:SDR family oxidoreductase [Myxococcaceae bacterium]
MAKQNLTALITGASSGIGLELAKVFAQEGYDLVLVARSKGKLSDLGAELSKAHGIDAQVIAADLADPASVETIAKELEARGTKVTALVNNAGYASYGPFAEVSPKEQLDMIQVNVVALTALSRRLLPGMLERRQGQILNVASTAAFQPGPLMAVYYATKSFVLSLSEALADELDGTGVTVTALCPGPTASGFQSRAKMEESKLVRGKKIMDATTVARAGFEAMRKGTRVAIPGFMNKVMANSVRLLPRSMVTSLVRKAQERANA